MRGEAAEEVAGGRGLVGKGLKVGVDGEGTERCRIGCLLPCLEMGC